MNHLIKHSSEPFKISYIVTSLKLQLLKKCCYNIPNPLFMFKEENHLKYRKFRNLR